MRVRIILYAFILACAPVLDQLVRSEEPKAAQGKATQGDTGTMELEAGAMGVYPSVTGNKAKFSEYGDIKDGVLGVYGSIYFNYDDKKGNFVKFNAVDMGYDTQSYRLDGGKRGRFKYFVFYKETPHNITYNAISPYAGSGTDTLAYGGAGRPSANTATWNPFDYSTKRKEYGAGVKLNMVKPFYFNVSVSQEKKTGTKPSGAEGATAGFGNAIELPKPVDYRTDYVDVEAGYGKKPLFLSLRYTYNQFHNNNDTLSFRNPFLTTQPNTDNVTLSPDNTFHKLAFAGNANLPLRSKFNMNLSYAMAKSDQNLMSSIWDGGVLTPLTLNKARFQGDVRTQNYDFVLTSNPLSFMEGKVFYKYYKKNNKSDTIATVEAGVTTVNNPFDYNKQSYGAELNFRIWKDLRLVAGYTHIDLDRNRDDIPKNEDDIYSLEFRWSLMKMGLLKVGYEKLMRTANHQVLDPTGDNAIEIYVRRFDAAAKDRETFKASLALSPLDELNLTLGYKYKKTSYTQTLLGLMRDETNEFNFDADYAIGKIARIFGYFDYDDRQSSQFQRRYAAGGNTNPYGGTQNATNFNWQSDQRDKTFDYGVALDFFVIPGKLTARFSADYLRSHGTNDFTYFTASALTAGRTNDNIDIGNWDSYKKEFYMVKLLYKLTSSTSLTAGYAYEKYSVSDAQYDGYQYTLGNPINTYLTGAYANPDYKANVVFFGVNHKFQ